MSKSEELKTLWKQICIKRCEMNQAYEQEKTTTERVLALSQELDQLLNAYDRMLKQDDGTENEG